MILYINIKLVKCKVKYQIKQNNNKNISIILNTIQHNSSYTIFPTRKPRQRTGTLTGRNVKNRIIQTVQRLPAVV